jgi:hypothetical protein
MSVLDSDPLPEPVLVFENTKVRCGEGAERDGAMTLEEVMLGSIQQTDKISSHH